jgi:hypothetical protein
VINEEKPIWGGAVSEKTLSIRFDLETYNKVREIAVKEKRSISSQIALFVEEELAKYGEEDHDR